MAYLSTTTHVYALDAVTGHSRWNYATGMAKYTTPLLVNDVLYLGKNGLEDNGLVALDALTGQQRWQLPCNPVSTALVMQDNVLYVGMADYNVLTRAVKATETILQAVEPMTGHQLWGFSAHLSGFVVSPLVFGNGLIYFGVSDENLYAVESATGHLQWISPIRAAGNPVLASGGEVILLKSYAASNTLYAVDALTGQQRWQFLGDATSPSPVVAGQMAYFATKQSVVALDTLSGQLQWKFAVQSFADTTSVLVLEGDMLYILTATTVYALDVVTRQMRWKVTLGRLNFGSVFTTLVVANQVVYITSSADSLYAINAATGKARWKFDLHEPIATTNSLVVANNRVYVPTDSDTTGAGTVYVLDA